VLFLSDKPAGEGDLILKESRHPCLEAQDDINFIPNDVELKRGTLRRPCAVA
jgi:DNA mismatch repair ATPase MutS